MLLKEANWIRPEKDFGKTCPVFNKEFKLKSEAEEATLYITAMGVYEAL